MTSKCSKCKRPKVDDARKVHDLMEKALNNTKGVLDTYAVAHDATIKSKLTDVAHCLMIAMEFMDMRARKSNNTPQKSR